MGMIDWRLHVVTSGHGDRVVEAAVAAARAGVGVVQVRAKDLSGGDLLDLVRAVADAVTASGSGTRVIVNDRVDVAVAARRRGADVHGVHLGQLDLPVEEARHLLGPDALVGLTAGTLELVREAQGRTGADRPDYLGAGPLRPTPTKDAGRPPVGVSGYPVLAAATSLPVVAIGDVGLGDVAALAGTGVAGVAVVRAVMEADSPGAVARALLAEWDRGVRAAASGP